MVLLLLLQQMGNDLFQCANDDGVAECYTVSDCCTTFFFSLQNVTPFACALACAFNTK